MSKSIRVVPDTNVIIGLQKSTRPNSPHQELFRRWQNEEFDLLYSEDILYEFVEKLIELGILDQTIRKLITAILGAGIEVHIETFHLRHYPVDPDDIAFLLCAVNSDALHLVTQDQHLLSLSHLYWFRICRTIDFLNDVRQQSSKS